MQIFRIFGQEPDSGDIRQHPGYVGLSPQAQQTVTETFNATYLANQSNPLLHGQFTSAPRLKVL